MTHSLTPASRRQILVICVLASVSVAATFGISFLLVPTERSWLVNLIAGFLAMVETGIGLLLVSSLARRGGGATKIVLLDVLSIYGVVGLATTFVYAAIRGDGENDGVFFAAMLFETVVAFVVAGAFGGNAAAIAAAETPVLAKRASHAAHGRRVREAITTLRGLSPREPAQMRQTDQLIKRLEPLVAALAHSHGSRIGSPESGTPDADESAEADLAAAAAGLASDTALLAGPDVLVGLEKLSIGAERLRSAVDRLGLA